MCRFVSVVRRCNPTVSAVPDVRARLRGPQSAPSRSLNVENVPVKDPDEVVLALWMRWNREVSISFSGDGRSHPWSVMIEGDQGSYGGESLLDALEHRLQGEAPEFSAGWGADAQ